MQGQPVPEQEDTHKEGQNRKKKAKQGTKRKQEDEDSGQRRRCLVCRSLGHTIERCFYARPELRPEGFRPNNLTQRICDFALQQPEVKEQLERLLKKRKLNRVEDDG